MSEKLARSIKVFFAGCCVYFGMAACAIEIGEPGSGGAASEKKPGDGVAITNPVPNALAEEWYRSGSRLKLQFLQAPDGARQFYGWYDTERKEACSFRKHALGSMRCMPPTMNTTYYRDQECSIPLGARAAKLGVPAAKYAAVAVDDGIQIYQVMGLHTGAIYSGGGDLPCSDVTAHVRNLDSYVLGEQLDPGAFAEGVVTDAP